VTLAHPICKACGLPLDEDGLCPKCDDDEIDLGDDKEEDGGE
jgi:hypothetical protein